MQSRPLFVVEMDWNEPAISFCEKLGADALKEWIAVRLDGEALEALAAPAAQGAT